MNSSWICSSKFCSNGFWNPSGARFEAEITSKPFFHFNPLSGDNFIQDHNSCMNSFCIFQSQKIALNVGSLSSAQAILCLVWHLHFPTMFHLRIWVSIFYQYLHFKAFFPTNNFLIVLNSDLISGRPSNMMADPYWEHHNHVCRSLSQLRYSLFTMYSPWFLKSKIIIGIKPQIHFLDLLMGLSSFYFLIC